LLNKIAELKIPLAMCPISNETCNFNSILNGNTLRYFLEKNLIVSINSDDPEYFDSNYIGDNYYKVAKKLSLNLDEITKLAKNSFISSFLDEIEKQKYLDMIDDYIKTI
jgi:adenosine deaminase